MKNNKKKSRGVKKVELLFSDEPVIQEAFEKLRESAKKANLIGKKIFL